MPTLTEILEENKECEDQRHVYLAYLYQKIAERDWHGVIDAAMDIWEAELREELKK